MQLFNMYSNKNEGPRRGRSFDSMNIGFEEKLLNNEVRTFLLLFVCLEKRQRMLTGYFVADTQNNCCFVLSCCLIRVSLLGFLLFVCLCFARVIVWLLFNRWEIGRAHLNE